jgi:hypothetical protein
MKVMQERICQTNREQIQRSPKKATQRPDKKAEARQAAEVMRQMTSGECREVINQLTTHEKIRMMHGIMETQRLQAENAEALKKEV